MADETNAEPTTEVRSHDATTAGKVKKTRAARRLKKEDKAAAAATVTAPVKRTRGPAKKANAAPAGAIQPASKAEKPMKAAVATNGAKRGPRKAAAAPVANDGFAELMQLEEENQKLRKALSDKLRTENADLRKKLGLS